MRDRATKTQFTCDSHIECEEACGNIYLRKIFMPPGGAMLGHAHTFDHTTFTLTPIRITRTELDGSATTVDLEPGGHALIEAGVIHRLESRASRRFWSFLRLGRRNTPNLFCIYSHRDPQGNVVQESTGWFDGRYTEARNYR